MLPETVPYLMHGGIESCAEKRRSCYVPFFVAYLKPIGIDLFFSFSYFLSPPSSQHFIPLLNPSSLFSVPQPHSSKVVSRLACNVLTSPKGVYLTLACTAIPA